MRRKLTRKIIVIDNHCYLLGTKEDCVRTPFKDYEALYKYKSVLFMWLHDW